MAVLTKRSAHVGTVPVQALLLLLLCGPHPGLSQDEEVESAASRPFIQRSSETGRPGSPMREPWEMAGHGPEKTGERLDQGGGGGRRPGFKSTSSLHWTLPLGHM